MSIQPWMEEYKKWNVNPEFSSAWSWENFEARRLLRIWVKFQDKTAFITGLVQKFSYQDIDIIARTGDLSYRVWVSLLVAVSRWCYRVLFNIQLRPFAIIRAGYVLVNVNPMYTQRELSSLATGLRCRSLDYPRTDFGAINSTRRMSCNLNMWFLLIRRISFRISQVSIYSQDKTQYPDKQFSDFRQAIDQVQVIDFEAPVQQQEDTMILQYTGGTAGVFQRCKTESS